MRAAIVATRQWIIAFTFLFLSVRNLKEVYEQENALKVTLFKSTSTSTSGNWPYLDLQPVPRATTWSNVALDLY